MLPFRRHILPAALLLLVAGCPRPVVRKPIDFGPRGRITDPAVAFAAVQARVASIDAVQGEAKAVIDSPEGGGKVTELVAAEKPRKIRLDSVTILGPVATLTSDGDAFALADFEHKRFYEGAETPENLGRMLPVRLPPEELVALLLGVPPLLPGAEPMALAVNDVEGVYELTIISSGDHEHIALDPTTLRPLWLEMDARPPLSGYRAEFNDFAEDHDLPKNVKLFTMDGRSKIELKWRDREVNPKLDPQLFTQSLPAGFERVAR